jgi:hypothetical protein
VVVVVIADDRSIVVRNFWNNGAFWLDRWRSTKVISSRPEASFVGFTLALSL